MSIRPSRFHPRRATTTGHSVAQSLKALPVSLVLLAGLTACATRHGPAPDAGANGVALATQPETLSFASLLADILDEQGLYTIAGGLKPMSSGFWTARVPADQHELHQVDEVRSLLAPLRNDLWYADVQAFAAVHGGERSFHAYVVHREALEEMVERHGSFWASHGVTPTTHPAEMIAVVDRMPRGDRWRGYGYLFGYPADAVDFFVTAGLAADASGGPIGRGNDREFMQIPTHDAETGRFTYAVPLDHHPTAADAVLFETAATILASYRQHRDELLASDDILENLRQLNAQHRSACAEASIIRDRQVEFGGTQRESPRVAHERASRQPLTATVQESAWGLGELRAPHKQINPLFQ